MADTDRINRIARHMHDTHQMRHKFENLTGLMAPASIDEAYDVQKALVRLWEKTRRTAVCGYKVALTSQAIRDLVGVDQPCAGVILSDVIREDPARYQASDFLRVGLEFELAFRIGRDVPGETTHDSRSIRDHVDAAAAAFELIEDRNADYGNLDPASLVADNAWNGGVVLGAFSGAWAEMDLSSVPAILSYNGQDETVITGAVMGNPLNSLAWLANLLAGQGRGLRAGDIVMSGSTLATKFPEKGDSASYAIEGLGMVRVVFE